jgi:hypothetical protein
VTAPKVEVIPPQDPLQDQANAYLQKLSKLELEDLERESLQHVESTIAEGYQRSRKSGGAAFLVYRRMILERGAKRRLFRPDEPTKSAA